MGSRSDPREERELWIGRVAILAVTSVVLLSVFLDVHPNSPARRDRRRANRTMASMRDLAISVEAYALEKGKFPSPAGSIADGRRGAERSGKWVPPPAWPVRKDQRASKLEPILSPRYVEKFPAEDAWGHPLLYATTPDRGAYVIVSTGEDGELEPPDSFVRGSVRDTRRDLVYSDGGFLLWMEGT